jgi:hypothetical protein
MRFTTYLSEMAPSDLLDPELRAGARVSDLREFESDLERPLKIQETSARVS